MAIGHTDDVTSGFGTFGLPNEYYDGVVGNIGSLISIGDTSNNFSRNINQERYDDILLPCQVIDDKIVDDYLNQSTPRNKKSDNLVMVEPGLVLLYNIYNTWCSMKTFLFLQSIRTPIQPMMTKLVQFLDLVLQSFLSLVLSLVEGAAGSHS